MKAVFMGTPEFAVPTLQALIDHHEVLAVVTQPDKQRGRGKKMQFPPVKEKAVEYDIPVYQPQRARDEEFIEELKNLNPARARPDERFRQIGQPDPVAGIRHREPVAIDIVPSRAFRIEQRLFPYFHSDR